MADINGELHRKAYKCPICDENFLMLYVLVTDEGEHLVVMPVTDLLVQIATVEHHTVTEHTHGIKPTIRRVDTGETHQQYLDRIHRSAGN